MVGAGYPRLRITEGNGESISPSSSVIVSLLHSSQRHLGESQRKTSSKTVKGPDRLWPALAERDFMIWGEEECMENRLPRAQCCSMGATQKFF